MRSLAYACVVLASAFPAVAGRVAPPPRVAAHPEAIARTPASYMKPASDPLTTISAVARCSDERPRASDVVFSWEVKHDGILAVRVDITEYADGFAAGQFVSSGELPPKSRRFDWPDAGAGVYYQWRLLIRRGDGWEYAGNGRFESPVCAKDDDHEESGERE